MRRAPTGRPRSLQQDCCIEKAGRDLSEAFVIIRGKCGIAGIGATKKGEHPDRSANELAVEAAVLAQADAGIDKKSIDGLITCKDTEGQSIDHEIWQLIGLKPAFPVNTNAGKLSEAYMWERLHMLDAVRQLRGECGGRQVEEEVDMTGVLKGLRVIDFGQYLVDPLTAVMLADQGADVIHVDPPGGPRLNSPADALLNRGKRRIVLDLKQPDDRPWLAAW